MAMLSLLSLMGMQRRRRRRPLRRRGIRAHDGSVVSGDERTKGPPCDHDENSQGDKRTRYSAPTLPEDILRHVHSLLPLRAAARVACVSQVFLNSWRCLPNLYISIKALDLKENSYEYFSAKVHHILKKHSGIGLRTLHLSLYGCWSVDFCDLCSWLYLAITSGVKDLILEFPGAPPKSIFPCSLLSLNNGSSIEYLSLKSCAFHPTIRIGCMRSLKRLSLCFVSITEDELVCFLSNSSALERLELMCCNEITRLKIPCLMLRLRYLELLQCKRLQVIESEAPILSSLAHVHSHFVQLSLGEALELKNVAICFPCAVFYAAAKLPTILPNLESLTIGSTIEVLSAPTPGSMNTFQLVQVLSAPTVPSKFLHLKYLDIRQTLPEFEVSHHDYFSLVSFLDASPSLETFILRIHVIEKPYRDKSWGIPWRSTACFPEYPSHLRRLPEYRLDKLKRAKIVGFFPALSLLELASYVVETATSLECLTLDTSHACDCHYDDPDDCHYNTSHDCHYYLLDFRKYVEGKVPSAARVNIEGTCGPLV